MIPKKTIAGLSATALLMGGVDASVLNEQPLERVEMVANERVAAKQLGNVVETTFPWKDQPGIKVKVDLGEPTITERFTDKRKKEVITETVNFGDGGFKVDILLNERPNTNRFCYAIEGAENYDFFYQPALTPEEKAEGNERAEDIVGSYAVYHKELKNHIVGQENYATGKVMHILRPQVWELENEVATKEWAELSYSEQEGLCVTARQEFLDNANYPVRIDPTFGYTTAGASSITSFVITCSKATTTEPGNITSISAYRSDTSAPFSDIAAAIYTSTSTGATLPDILLARNSPNIAHTDTVAAWFTVDVSYQVAPATTYNLCSWASNTTGTENMFYDAASGDFRVGQKAGTFDTFPSPFGSLSIDLTFSRASIYATYTQINFPTIKLNNGFNIKGSATIK